MGGEPASRGAGIDRRGAGGGEEVLVTSAWRSLEQVPSSSCCLLSKSGYDGRVLLLYCSCADTLGSRWRWVGAGGAVVSSLMTKSSTTIKGVSGYIVIRGMWLCVFVGRKSW